MLAGEVGSLELEFLRYQADTIPSHIVECEHIDAAWHMIDQLKDLGQQKYKHLSMLHKDTAK